MLWFLRVLLLFLQYEVLDVPRQRRRLVYKLLRPELSRKPVIAQRAACPARRQSCRLGRRASASVAEVAELRVTGLTLHPIPATRTALTE